jgi:hypothetical protein
MIAIEQADGGMLVRDPGSGEWGDAGGVRGK